MNRWVTLLTLVCLLLVGLFSGTSAKQVPPFQAPDQAKPAAPNQSPSLADFSWLAGRWRGDWGPRTAEQDWFEPKAGMMLGTFRLVEDDKTLVIELYTLLQKSDGVELRFRHFTPELANWEKGDPTVLSLESLDGKKFVFVNPVNGQPKHSILTRIDQDTYVSRSEIISASGDLQVVEITYHREKTIPGQAAAKPHSARK
jgi:hypothetical protein